MPHALSDRQREYLAFVKHYVAQNESAPRLEEIAAHFAVQPPTAHKTLRAVQQKGYLIADHTPESCYFVHLLERGGSQEVVLRVPVVGKINQLGEVYDFPGRLG